MGFPDSRRCSPSFLTPQWVPESCCPLTYHRLQHTLGDFNELLVDLNGKVTQHLAVFSEVEVLKTVLILLGRILSHEALQRERAFEGGSAGLPGLHLVHDTLSVGFHQPLLTWWSTRACQFLEASVGGALESEGRAKPQHDREVGAVWIKRPESLSPHLEVISLQQQTQLGVSSRKRGLWPESLSISPKRPGYLTVWNAQPWKEYGRVRWCFYNGKFYMDSIVGYQN